MTTQDLITAFTSYKRQSGKNSTGSLSFHGNKLYSYALLIAEYVSKPNEGFQGLVIYDYTAKGLGFRSMTTSQHVSLLKNITKYHPRRVIGQDE